jgi:hypothetical protein
VGYIYQNKYSNKLRAMFSCEDKLYSNIDYVNFTFGRKKKIYYKALMYLD